MYEYHVMGYQGETLAVAKGHKSWIKAMFHAWNAGWTNTNCERVVVGKEGCFV